MDKYTVKTYGELDDIGIFMLTQDRGFNVYIDVPGRRDESTVWLHDKNEMTENKEKIFVCELFGDDITISEEELRDFEATTIVPDPMGDDVVALFVTPSKEWFDKNHDKLAKRKQTAEELYCNF
jgi:hypothetical protein